MDIKNMDDCIFCKISKGEIPSIKIYEDSEFFAFIDINPVAKGHALLVPKFHTRWMDETEDDVVSKIFILGKNLMKKMKQNLPCEYVQVNIVGEEIPHFHIHLIPRYIGDGIVKWTHQKYESEKEMQDYALKIKG